MKRVSTLALAIPLLLIACGCGEEAMDYSSLNLVPVTGKVTLDGFPLANARVRFVGEDGSGSEGTTDSAGRYVLRYDSNQLGGKPGRMKVKITTSIEAATDDPDAASKNEKIAARYNSATELEVEVSSDQSAHNFALTTH